MAALQGGPQFRLWKSNGNLYSRAGTAELKPYFSRTAKKFSKVSNIYYFSNIFFTFTAEKMALAINPKTTHDPYFLGLGLSIYIKNISVLLNCVLPLHCNVIENIIHRMQSKKSLKVLWWSIFCIFCDCLCFMFHNPHLNPSIFCIVQLSFTGLSFMGWAVTYVLGSTIHIWIHMKNYTQEPPPLPPPHNEKLHFWDHSEGAKL